ncbi:WD40 repeat domain-containing serine/threonine-protein kinase [Thermoleptolyngbya sp. PKUAC-SCTB121]|uniref:WD40 repeat domain-containing serine/threonine-protein kinase n=1 Tax=Thermoleptolyngbya sp. PKUAC-SCTB121 TaxID=2811482 RepID=UPI0019639198|nr:WD40 repeat domain-containing serine/threonine-protein kinase [Thermoleptolyngbya sp. PKUAC-SCTB121]
MSLCINPQCTEPNHPGNDGSRFCQSCGSDLVLRERYRVMRLISDKSGFGQVYEAYERNVPKILKVLKEIHSGHSKAVALFQREAVVLSQLRHPGVPAIEPDGYFQFLPRGSESPLHCIIMEKIDGPNLREWMRQQGNHGISEAQARRWMRQLTEVLHLVHERNYFHRDIKPENIMLRSNGQLVLVDFGAVREMTATYLAQLGGSEGVTRISSAGYTPPEQERGQAVPQSDFYALGWTFIYLLTGKQPTDPDIYNPHDNSFRWRQFAPQVSEPFADFIDRLIAPKASDRPSSTREILEDLAAIAPPSNLPRIQALAARPAESPSSPRTTQLQPAQTQTQHTPFRWKYPWLWSSATALLIGLAGWGGWRAYQQFSGGIVAVQPLVSSATLTGHTGFINHAVFTPDGQRLITCGADHQIILWDVATGQPLRTLKGHSSYVNAVVLSGNGQTLASGGADNQILIWDLPSGTIRHTLVGHTNAVNALTIASDGTLISGSADGTVRTWNLTTGQPIHTLEEHDGFINAIAVSPDARTIVSGGTDITLMVWDLRSGTQRRTLSGFTGVINAIAFTPDGVEVLAGGTDRTIYRWNLETGEQGKPLTGSAGFINTLAVRGDGRTLLSSDAEGQLTLWDLVTGKPTHIFAGEGAPLDHAVVSPDWRTIATGKGFSTVRLWQLPDDVF